jgi:hypothetical protein
LTLKRTLDPIYSAALDCRHGCILIHIPHNRGAAHHLEPHHWRPAAPKSASLPPLAVLHTGSVLCATKACDHLDCGGGPFFVVFVWTWWMNDVADGMNIQASIYSSETGAWSTLTPIDINCYIHVTPGLLIGETLYFTISIQGS